jgi:hypothetical protein
MGEVSNSQRHKASTLASTLAGTHNLLHRSQPAKELAFCSAWVTVFRWTQLKFKSLITDRQKGERTTGGLPKYGLTEVIFGICNSTVLHIQLDIIYLAFCCYLQLQFLNHHWSTNVCSNVVRNDKFKSKKLFNSNFNGFDLYCCCYLL